MGKPGRLGLQKIIPELKTEYSPDVMLANVENLTHGKGIIEKHIIELNNLGFDAYTSGNHVFDSGPHAEDCFDKFPQIIRPANYTGINKHLPGSGYYRFAKNGQQFLVINLSGQVFMNGKDKFEITNAFFEFDKIYQDQASKDDIIIVDLHAEATSEKQALAWYIDGRAHVLYGTHTHVPTNDAKILPKGLATQTDVGMTGDRDSVIGVIPDSALVLYLQNAKPKLDIVEAGIAVVNALYVEIENGRATNTKIIQKEIEV